MEIWKAIDGFESYYEISNTGKVRSIDRIITNSLNVKSHIKGKEIKPFIVNGGYLQVRLNKENKASRFYVHVLVAKAFIPNPFNLKEVNHKDYDKSNNNASNLEWITHKNNIIDMVEHKRKLGIFKDDKKCIDCGCIISGEKRCKKCYTKYMANRQIIHRRKDDINYHKTLKPSKEELSKLLENNNYSSIARIYCVSSNAVKKWAKKYNLYEYQFHTMPDIEEFAKLAQNKTLLELATNYNVPTSTIKSWAKHMNIQIKKFQIICVETNKKYKSAREIARVYEPNKNTKIIAERITKVIDTNKTFYGLHWKRIISA